MLIPLLENYSSGFPTVPCEKVYVSSGFQTKKSQWRKSSTLNSVQCTLTENMLTSYNVKTGNLKQEVIQFLLFETESKHNY